MGKKSPHLTGLCPLSEPLPCLPPVLYLPCAVIGRICTSKLVLSNVLFLSFWSFADTTRGVSGIQIEQTLSFFFFILGKQSAVKSSSWPELVISTIISLFLTVTFSWPFSALIIDSCQLLVQLFIIIMAFLSTFLQYIELIFYLFVLLVCLPYIEVFPDFNPHFFHSFTVQLIKEILSLPNIIRSGPEIVKRLVPGEIG